MKTPGPRTHMPHPRAAAAAIAAAILAPAAAHGDITFFDDGAVALRAVVNAGGLEPPVPLYLNGLRVNNPATPAADAYFVIDIFDRVPGTTSYPLTAADIIANGYIRPLVQRADGLTDSIGTSVVTGPSFRPLGQPLDLIPEITRADVATGVPGRFTITGTGDYAGRATLLCTRRYPDPLVGRTEIGVEYTWTATQSITLPTGPTGRGFDAFRLIMLSSMIASLPGGEYDARYLAVTDPLGRRRTIELPDQPGPGHLFPAPLPTAVGRSFALLKDRAATWNPGSPSIEVRIVAVSLPAGQLGVNAYLANTANPNDDSLSVWLEWTGAPATIPAGAQITASFTIIATPATDPGDLDHDGDLDCGDRDLLLPLLGHTLSDPLFDAYADLDRSGAIDAADLRALGLLVGAYPADFNLSGTMDSADISAFLTAWIADVSAGTLAADVDGNAIVNSADISAFLTAWIAALNSGC